MTHAGFYGKIASRGDFVSRDLPQSFIQPWDRWLAAGLLACQQQLGSDWLQAYLVSPLWRFALAPGVCGPQAVAGVLMPSIDRVGRYFPLTVAVLLDESQPVSAWLGVDDWFEQVEALMLDSLAPDNRFEAFEASLQALPVPVLEAGVECQAQGGLQRLQASTAALRLAALAEQGCTGASLWWGRGGEHIAPGLWRCHGLPGAADFASALLGLEAVGQGGQA